MVDSSGRRGVIGLDLVRFAAGVGVAVYHLAYWWWLPTVTGDQGRAIRDGLTWMREPFRWGWVNIEIFFVLSGFVIANSANGKTAKTFVRNRAVRLYPTAWICGTWTLLLVKLGSPDALAEYARTLSLWIYGPWISGVYWTLSIEIIFYALVALALWVKVKPRTLGLFLGYLSSLYWLLRVLDFVSGEPAKDLFALVEGTPTGSLSLLATGNYFGSGILLWSLAFDKSSRFDLVSLAIFLLASLVAVVGAGHYKIAVEGGQAWQAIEPALFWIIGIAAILLSVRWNDLLWRLLGRYVRQIQFLGLTTYPLYLVHSDVGAAIMLHATAIGVLPALILSFGLVLVLSSAIVVAEPYSRKWIKDLLSVRLQQRALAPADLP